MIVITDISWCMTQVLGQGYNMKSVRAEYIDEYELDIDELIEEDLTIDQARIIALNNLLMKLNK